VMMQCVCNLEFGILSLQSGRAMVFTRSLLDTCGHLSCIIFQTCQPIMAAMIKFDGMMLLYILFKR
jgi:hypothetical protein